MSCQSGFYWYRGQQVLGRKSRKIEVYLKIDQSTRLSAGNQIRSLNPIASTRILWIVGMGKSMG